jgi:hypothetical protein
MSQSLVHEGYAVVMLKRPVWVDGLLLTRHGQHGAVHCLSLADALRLCEAGDAKLPGHTHIAALRDVARPLRKAPPARPAVAEIPQLAAVDAEVAA